MRSESTSCEFYELLVSPIPQPVFLQYFGTCPAQDGAGPPSVWRSTRPQSRNPPPSAARPLQPRERQREGGVRPRSGRSGAKCWGAGGSRHHPFLGAYGRNLQKDGCLVSAETTTAYFIFGSCVPHSPSIKQQIRFAHFCSRLWFWGPPSRSRRMFSGY